MGLVFVSRWLIVASLALAACAGGGREVQVEVNIPGPDSVDAPLAHLTLVALPYDRDSVLRALQGDRQRPPEIVARLDTLYARFRKPFGAYANLAYKVQTLERTNAFLRLKLDSLPRSAPAYDSLYQQFTRRADSIKATRQQRDRAQEELALARIDLGPTIDSLRRILVRWEDSTYRGYDSITKKLGDVIGRQPFTDSTRADGKVTLRLGPGPWWIYARSWDAWDPHSEWYWNVPVTGERVLLDKNTGRRRPRY
ncbi:MAG TPA: hypothetical protein VG817_06790 [Gemmatimonadales bacterium]|nr:hypothetical protein [Gemmatimonadales bacterium]